MSTSQGTDIAIRLLAAGYTASSVADTLNCEVDVIEAVQEEYSQQIADTALEISRTPAAKESSTTKELSHDANIDKAEALALEKLMRMLPMETNIMRAAKLFQTLNSAKRRDSGEGLQPGTHVTVDNRQVVMLNIPEHMCKRPEFTTNAQNEVVAVQGRPLAIAGSDQIKRMAGLLEETTDESQTVLAGD